MNVNLIIRSNKLAHEILTSCNFCFQIVSRNIWQPARSLSSSHQGNVMAMYAGSNESAGCDMEMIISFFREFLGIFAAQS